MESKTSILFLPVAGGDGEFTLSTLTGDGKVGNRNDARMTWAFFSSKIIHGWKMPTRSEAKWVSFVVFSVW